MAPKYVNQKRVCNKFPTSSNSALLFIRNNPLGGAGGIFFLGNAFLSCKKENNNKSDDLKRSAF